jgi:hypothetical protein
MIHGKNLPSTMDKLNARCRPLSRHDEQAAQIGKGKAHPFTV